MHCAPLLECSIVYSEYLGVNADLAWKCRNAFVLSFTRVTNRSSFVANAKCIDASLSCFFSLCFAAVCILFGGCWRCIHCTGRTTTNHSVIWSSHWLGICIMNGTEYGCDKSRKAKPNAIEIHLGWNYGNKWNERVNGMQAASQKGDTE